MDIQSGGKIMPAGRPLKFKNKEEVQILVDKYFNACKNRRMLLAGIELTEDQTEAIEFTEDVHPTITGMALALDTTRDLLVDYEEKVEYSDTVKKAKLRVESYSDQRLFGNNVAGVIFSLKNNFNWKDKTELESTNRIEIIELQKDFGE